MHVRRYVAIDENYAAVIRRARELLAENGGAMMLGEFRRALIVEFGQDMIPEFYEPAEKEDIEARYRDSPGPKLIFFPVRGSWISAK